MKLYADEAVLLPAFSTRMRKGQEQIRNFYIDLFEKDDIKISVYQVSTQKINRLKVDSGMYAMKWKIDGFLKEKHLRFSLVIKNGKIITDHSSIEPQFNESLDSLPKAYKKDYVNV